MQITALDPLRFGLVFERFLNPERISMPDFDIDFCQDRRGEVIRYVQGKYGHDRVAQIITFGTLQARAAIRDVGRVLQMPQGQVDRIAKMIKVQPGQTIKLREAIEHRAAPAADGERGGIRRAACSKSRASSKASTATPRPMPPASSSATGRSTRLVPLYRDPSSDMPVTQFDYEDDEKAGLVKFDFLGLKTLTVIAETEQMIFEAPRHQGEGRRGAVRRQEILRAAGQGHVDRHLPAWNRRACATCCAR